MTLNQIHALVQSHNRQHINSNHLCLVHPVSRSASAFVWHLISSLHTFFFCTCEPESHSCHFAIWENIQASGSPAISGVAVLHSRSYCGCCPHPEWPGVDQTCFSTAPLNLSTQRTHAHALVHLMELAVSLWYLWWSMQLCLSPSVKLIFLVPGQKPLAESWPPLTECGKEGGREGGEIYPKTWVSHPCIFYSSVSVGWVVCLSLGPGRKYWFEPYKGIYSTVQRF